jgi:hypothetical protein
MTFANRSVALVLIGAATACIALVAFTDHSENTKTENQAISCKTMPVHKACVFKTFMGLESFDTSTVRFDRRLTEAAIRNGLNWILQAQHTNGGWGAGSHYNQQVHDPHAVPADPATTALVGMALLRTEEKPFDGRYAVQLEKAVNYLLKAVNTASPQSSNITELNNTQPQSKLGKNIDVILTAQFFSNALHHAKNNMELKADMEKALQKCVQKIQKGQDHDGGWKDGGWAPVLQSAMANSALESAKDMGVKVDSVILEKSRSYQKNNYDTKTNSAVTGKAAGVLLYSVSSSARASAKEAKIAKDKIELAKKEGKLKEKDDVTEDNLVKAGYTRAEAQKYATAYKIKGAAVARAQDSKVESGFGSNGGEEFLSYLQTGESLIIGGGNEWKSWYEKMSGRLVQIQNDNGSWNGHHCITSPVFCTATCLLILSIDKDIDFLLKQK